jgi:hypothetical protein
VHAQWCRDRARILGRGSGYCMLSSQHITLISIGVTRLHKRYGLVRNLLSHILRYLAAMHMFMFQRKIGVSWIRRLKNVSLLDIKMVSKAIIFGTQKIRR